MTKVIWNADAGRRTLALAKLDEAGVTALLRDAGLDFEVCATKSADEAEAIARSEVEAGAQLVVAAGGDGTIGTVAQVLLDTQVTLGILPLGSVMNIPRMLGIPRDSAAAARIIAAGVARTIDVGEANGRVFFETVQVGIGASIFDEAQRIEAATAARVFRALRNAFRYRPRRMHIELDDGRTIETSALLVTVGNGPYMGLAMTVSPDAPAGRRQVRRERIQALLEDRAIHALAAIAFGRRQLLAARDYRALEQRAHYRPAPTAAACRRKRAWLYAAGVPRQARRIEGDRAAASRRRSLRPPSSSRTRPSLPCR